MTTTATSLHSRVSTLMPQARTDLAEPVARQSIADPRQFPASECLKAALIGVEESRCLIHAPNESVDPAEIEHLAPAEALFLATYPT